MMAGSGLLDAAILLNNVAGARLDDIERFVAAICKPNWLARQYKSTDDAPLAGALVLLGLSQPPAILHSFWSSTLTARIGAALAALASAETKCLCMMVQLVGAAGLIGLRMPPAPIAAARLDRIAQLPVDVLPHRLAAGGIEDYQRNLWLGLRAVATLAPVPLPVSQDVIEDTLRRWRVNLQVSAVEPGALSIDSTAAWSNGSKPAPAPAASCGHRSHCGASPASSDLPELHACD